LFRGLLRFDAVCFDMCLRKYSEEHMSSVFNPEDGSRMFLRNTGGHLPGYGWKAEYSYKALAFFRNNL
jgi:hypothetical protein